MSPTRYYLSQLLPLLFGQELHHREKNLQNKRDDPTQ